MDRQCGMFLWGGWKLKNPEEIHSDKKRGWLHTDSKVWTGSNQGAWMTHWSFTIHHHATRGHTHMNFSSSTCGIFLSVGCRFKPHGHADSKALHFATWSKSVLSLVPWLIFLFQRLSWSVVDYWVAIVTCDISLVLWLCFGLCLSVTALFMIWIFTLTIMTDYSHYTQGWFLIISWRAVGIYYSMWTEFMLRVPTKKITLIRKDHLSYDHKKKTTWVCL